MEKGKKILMFCQLSLFSIKVMLNFSLTEFLTTILRALHFPIDKAIYDLRAIQDNLLPSLNKTWQPLNQGNILPLSLCSIYLSQ